MMGFGTLGQNTMECNTECLLFGVIATHGAIKKSDKPAKSDLNKVKVIREKYFETKKN
jgi:hypothetical protein